MHMKLCMTEQPGISKSKNSCINSLRIFYWDLKKRELILCNTGFPARTKMRLLLLLGSVHRQEDQSVCFIDVIVLLWQLHMLIKIYF